MPSPGRSGTVYELSRILRGDFSPGFGSSRLGIWKETLALVPERPLLGGGPGTLALRVDIRFSRFVPETGQTLSTYVDNAHNEYLGFLADLGIPGLALYLGAMGRHLFLLPAVAGPRVPWGCALVCYWIQAFFGLGLCLTAPLLWLSWGLFLSGGRQEPAIPPGQGREPALSRKLGGRCAARFFPRLPQRREPAHSLCSYAPGLRQAAGSGRVFS